MTSQAVCHATAEEEEGLVASNYGLYAERRRASGVRSFAGNRPDAAKRRGSPVARSETSPTGYVILYSST